MKRIALTLGAAAALLACVAKQPENKPKVAPERALFDGTTLDGWDGDPRYWSVENGCIVGRSTAANPLTETTYLLWRGGEVANFELRCEFKITGGNSGVQFRSRDTGNWKVAGYQADMEDGPSWTGCLYEQEGRGVVATRGQRVELDGGAPQVGVFGDASELLTHVHVHDWNEYVIRAVGDVIELSVNGTRMTQVVDHDAKRRRHNGIVALQLHQGDPMQVEYRNLRLLDLGATPALAGAAPIALVEAKHVPSPGQPPQWIWTQATAASGERAAFERHFDLPQGVTRATLRGACDNRMRLFVNGEFATDAKEWTEPVELDVTKLVRAGDNEIAIAAHNDGAQAALWIELVVEAGNKRVLRLLSDASWSATRLASEGAFEAWAPEQFDAKHASPPHVLGSFGCAPWGTLGAAVETAKGAPKVEDELALDGAKLVLPDGFRAELLYSVPKSVQGSWVSMAEDPRGRLYVSDQYGGLYRVTPPPMNQVSGAAAETLVEPVEVDLGESQGMCWAFDSLYVTVNSGGEKHHSGLYRVRDTDGDDKLDLVTCLRQFDGDGEHGPHAVVPGPDNKLWIVAGNFTHLPEPIDNYHRPKNWAEDELLPHLVDAGGHDPHIMAPGGWVCRTDEDGKSWELWCAGMRNAYDIAFDDSGELYTFDSDMEWDIGAPWYRPTRILHLVSGADFGWRNGSGKWPAYWPDTVPSVVDIGPGSPTGIAFGKQAKFPNQWRDSLFVLDWAYGTVFAVDLARQKFEKFITGKPFPVTDIVIAKDGAMYITTGGRRTQSGLYRITWTRDLEPADRLARDRSTPLDRNASAGAPGRDPTQDKWRGAPIDSVIAGLGSSNAFEVLGARVELEKRDFGEWRAALESEKDSTHIVQLVLAALHSAPTEQRELILAKLDALPVEYFSVYPRIDIYRLYQLALLRLAPLDDATLAKFRARLEPQFPSRFERVNYILAELLTYLEVPSTIDKCLDLLAQAPTQEEKLQYVYCLRAMKTGWTIEQRKRFFEFLNGDAKKFTGGNSLAGFVNNMRDEAIATLSDEEKLALGDAVVPSKPAASTGTAVVASFIRAWNAEELAPKLREPLHGRSFDNGKAAYAKATCAQCHRIAGDGGATGPDLTGAGSRFSRADLLDAILEPSKAISDQFQDTEVRTVDGDLYVGRVERDDAKGIALHRLPPSEEVVELDRSEIESRRLHPLSRMPSGLLDVLSEDEILDLFAYVLAGGDVHNASFTQ